MNRAECTCAEWEILKGEFQGSSVDVENWGEMMKEVKSKLADI